MKKLILLGLSIIFLTTTAIAQKGKVKSAQKIIDKGKYKYYTEQSYFNRWKSKWDKVIQKGNLQKFKTDFLLQSKKILSDQLKVLKDYIYQGDEYDAEKQRDYLENSYLYVKTNYPNFDKEAKINDLNEHYLQEAVNLTKIVKARQYLSQKNYEQWYKKWQELPTPLKEKYQIDSFKNQAQIVLENSMKTLKKYISEGDEDNTEQQQAITRKYFDFAQQKYAQFTNEIQIPDLNYQFLNNSVNFAKIQKAQKYIEQKNYDYWIGKWEEIGIIKPEYKEDMKKQSIRVFKELWQKIKYYQNQNDFSQLEKWADKTKNILERTLKIFPEFEQIRLNEYELQFMTVDYLSNIRRNSKINVAQNLAESGNYNQWINKWFELSREDFLTEEELSYFNKQADYVLNNIIEQIKQNTKNGNISKTKELSSLALQFWKQDIPKIDPNYKFKNPDINEIFLKNMPYLAEAYYKTYNERYLEAVEFMKRKAESIISSPQFKQYYTEFFTENLKRIVEDYYRAHQRQDFNAINDYLLEMNKIWNLKPTGITISYVPEIFNERHLYKNFKSWLDSRFNKTLDFYYNLADSLIARNLYVDAYNYVFKFASKITITSTAQQRLNKYQNLFENQGTNYYKSVIYNYINENKYLLAKKTLNDQLLYINPDFDKNRSNEYRKILLDIKNSGTTYYIKQRDYYLNYYDDYAKAHKYCDSIGFINKDYNIRKCHDEVTFERLYNKIQNIYLKSDLYICALDSAKYLLKLDVDDDKKAQAQQLINTCNKKAILAINIEVDLDYSFPTSESTIKNYIYNILSDYPYDFPQYVKFVNNSYDANLIVKFTVENFDYDYGWDNTEKRYLCKKYHKTETKTITYTEKEYITKYINGVLYYQMYDPWGNAFWGTFINGVLWYIGLDGRLYVYPYQTYSYAIQEVEKEKTVNVDYYKYHKVYYTMKYGSEQMYFTAIMELIDKRDRNYTALYQTKRFSYSKKYEKAFRPSSYNLSELCECPSGVSYDTWTETNKTCYSVDTDPFETSDNPFYGKTDFYNSYLKSSLNNFIQTQAQTIINKINEIHNSMKCR